MGSTLVGVPRASWTPLDLRTPFGVDTWVNDWLQAHRNGVLDVVSNSLMWLGSTARGALTVVVVVVVLSLWRRKPGTAPAVGIAVVIAEVVGTALKMVVQRPRPPQASQLNLVDWSFPSTAVATCTAALVVLSRLGPASHRGRRRLAAALVVLDLAVAFGVMYVGAHWFSDAVAGALLGVLAGWPVLRVTDALARRRARRRARRSARHDAVDT